MNERKNEPMACCQETKEGGTAMNEQQRERTSWAENIEKQVETVVNSAMQISKLWARHGLEVSRSALETSAETLRTTAEAIKRVADRLGTAKPPEDKAAP